MHLSPGDKVRVDAEVVEVYATELVIRIKSEILNVVAYVPRGQVHALPEVPNVPQPERGHENHVS